MVGHPSSVGGQIYLSMCPPKWRSFRTPGDFVEDGTPGNPLGRTI